jgi:translation initiation factor SUI1
MPFWLSRGSTAAVCVFIVIVTLISPFSLLTCLTLLDIRIQQRNGRKTLTTVQGIPDDIDQKRLLKAFKKEFACNGTLVEDEEMGEVIQLQGDQRLKVQTFLVDEEIAPKNQIKMHGF